jgi:hypothetical protein
MCAGIGAALGAGVGFVVDRAGDEWELWGEEDEVPYWNHY